ncbi:S-adenosyl-L-methionine-dependent methyltransferase [Russula dissimulans]|nr:S-adenosyl-L-methionine-dependent methyltransferase [Russula dissimulans]
MLSRANHRVRCLPFSSARNLASSSNGAKLKRSRSPKLARVTSEQASDALEGAGVDPIASQLNHYFSLPSLPPTEEWLSRFSYVVAPARNRVSVRNPASAIRAAHNFINSKKTSTSKPKVIIEAFPGPGVLSRALLTLPPSQLRRLIILEDHEPYLQYLRPLAQADPRVRVVPRSGFVWDTYTYLSESGDLDSSKYIYTHAVHPELHFVTHIPQTIPGEQLVAQLLRCIPERSWLFKYGRIPMSFILADWVWRRISAPPDSYDRCKLSVIAEASSHFFPSLPPEELSPFVDHFHPVTHFMRAGRPDARPENRRRGNPFVAVSVVPHDEQVINKGKLDQWDYILRRLFVLKSTPLRKAMSSLAPGAEVLLDSLTDKTLPPEQRVDVRLKVKHLTVSDWTLIARAFDAWPFAPDVCPFTDVLCHRLNSLPLMQELNIDSYVAAATDRD